MFFQKVYLIRNNTVKKQISENELLGLQTFLSEVTKLNEIYISFKTNNDKMRNKTKKLKDYYFNQIQIMNNIIENKNNKTNMNCCSVNSIQTLPRDNLNQKSSQIFNCNQEEFEYDLNSDKTIQDLGITLTDNSITEVIYLIFIFIF